MCKISVIVPVYNVEQYLCKCINSLLVQTLKDIELIFINDCSPDNSIAILRDYESKYPHIVKVIDSPVNLRQGGARNLGINIATGEYIGFVDSDDYVLPAMFEKLYIEAKKEAYDVVGCQHILVDKEYNKIREQRYNTIDQVGSLNEEEKRKSLIIRGGSVWSHIYKRSFLNDFDIRFPENLFYEDNYFVTMVFLKAGSFGLVNEPLYCYYQRENSTVNKVNSNNIFDALKTFDLIIENCKKEDGLYEKYFDELEYLRIVITYLHMSASCIVKFKPINYKMLYEIRRRIRENNPKYYKNKYYIALFSFAQRKLLRLNDLSPKIYAPISLTAYKIAKMLKKK